MTPNTAQRWKPNVTVAAVIARVEGGVRRYLLVEEETADGPRFNNPAGHLERGESPQQAVVREVLEETGRIFVPDRLIGVYLSRTRRTVAASGASGASGAAPAAAGAATAPTAGDVTAAAPYDITYLRLAFGGTVGEADPALPLDHGIVRALWLSVDEVRAAQSRHRSPLLLRCVEDDVAGRRLPLDVVVADPSIFDV